MMVELRDKFRDEKDALQKEEMEAKFAFEKLSSHLRDNKNHAQKEIDDKIVQESKRSQDKANAEGAKAEAERVKAEDSQYLTATRGLCTAKATDFASRQKLRAEELEAIDKAKEIISGLNEPSKVANGGNAASAFAQLRSSRSSQGNVNKVLALLKSRAATSHSPMLAALVQQVATVAQSSDDPFAKVKGMIADMIKKLMEQANAEADHKGWCDAELATNKQTRQIKSDEVEQLTTTVESLNAEIIKLSTDLEDLADEISKTQQEVAEADAQRAEERAKNNQVVDEANEAVVAVGQALAVMRAFYAKAAEATALTQMAQSPAEDAPETFDSSYKGQSGGGLVGMLEVLESDYQRLSSETATEEAVAQSNYEKFKADSEQDMAVNQAEVEHKTNKRSQRQSELSITKSTLQKTTDSLDASVKYYNSALEPTCVDSGMSYEERVANRKEEMQSLKEAYEIIAGEEIPSLQEMKAEQLR
jgi:outer membrane murein-binding lipoprotein Lpp